MKSLFNQERTINMPLLEPFKAAIKIGSLQIIQLRLRLFLTSRQLYRSLEYICWIQATTHPFRTFDLK